jgi:hypothetical protein
MILTPGVNMGRGGEDSPRISPRGWGGGGGEPGSGVP